MSRWILSVDLGFSIDPTAIAVIEATTRREIAELAARTLPNYQPGEPGSPPLDWFTPENERGSSRTNRLKHPSRVARLDVRHLSRLPLRTSYPDVVSHVATLLRRPPLRNPRADLVIDATGVGRPVVQLFERAGLKPIAVTITSGDAETRTPEGEWRVAKLQLVSRLQALLHSGELRTAEGLTEAKAFASELMDFRATFSDSGNVRFGAREGQHDDLVLAVAIGAWWASRHKIDQPLGTFSIG
jgi:hypothetical protein